MLSDPRILIAFWIGVLASFFAGVLLLTVLQLRWQRLQHVNRRKLFRQQVKLNLISLLTGELLELPTVNSLDMPEFLLVWLHFQELLRGDSQLLLKQAVISAGLQAPIRALLQSPRIEDQLLAATASRFLGDELAWGELLVLLRNNSSVLSMTAMWALVAIDAERAAIMVMPLIAERQDWSAARLVGMLREVKPDLQQVLLHKVIQQASASPKRLLRMLRLFAVLPQNRPLSIVDKLAPTSVLEPEMLSVCLRLVSHPAELVWVRSCFGDPRAHVQVQIAGILARLGMPQDVDYLLVLLDSEYWWVRYRAGQALLQQPFLSRQAVERLINSRTDSFARDMLLQIVAENSK